LYKFPLSEKPTALTFTVGEILYLTNLLDFLPKTD